MTAEGPSTSRDERSSAGETDHGTGSEGAVGEELRRARLGASHARLHVALLAEAGDILSTALDRPSLDRALTELRGSVVPAFCDWFSVNIGAPSTTSDGSYHPHPDGHELTSRVEKEGATVVLMDLPSSRRNAAWSSRVQDVVTASPTTSVGSMAIVPLRSAGRPVGSLAFVTLPARRGLRPSDLDVALGLAQRVAVAFERVELLWSERSTRQRLQAVLDSSPLAVAEIDAEGRGLWWNDAARELLGWCNDETASRPSLDRLPGVLVEVVERARRGDRTVGAHLEVKDDRGSAKTLSIAAAPVGGVGDTAPSVVLVAEDVTEQRRLERRLNQIQRQSAVTQLASGVAHDFNNLLTVILGSVETLRARLGDPEVAARALRQDVEGDIAAIERAGRRAAMLTAQLLDLQAPPEEDPEEVDLDEVVASLSVTITRLIGPDLAFEHVGSADGRGLLIQRSVLERVILNLVINARDATAPPGRVSVETSYDGPSERLALCVADSGSGMDEETAASCFEPFFTTKGPGGGTGLGLAGVMAAVTQANGDVTLETAPGQGSRFTLWFPAAPSVPSPSGADQGSKR